MMRKNEPSCLLLLLIQSKAPPFQVFQLLSISDTDLQEMQLNADLTDNP